MKTRAFELLLLVDKRVKTSLVDKFCLAITKFKFKSVTSLLRYCLLLTKTSCRFYNVFLDQPKLFLDLSHEATLFLSVNQMASSTRQYIYEQIQAGNSHIEKMGLHFKLL